jgi:hypothetical protein
MGCAGGLRLSVEVAQGKLLHEDEVQYYNSAFCEYDVHLRATKRYNGEVSLPEGRSNYLLRHIKLLKLLSAGLIIP